MRFKNEFLSFQKILGYFCFASTFAICCLLAQDAGSNPASEESLEEQPTENEMEELGEEASEQAQEDNEEWWEDPRNRELAEDQNEANEEYSESPAGETRRENSETSSEGQEGNWEEMNSSEREGQEEANTRANENQERYSENNPVERNLEQNYDPVIGEVSNEQAEDTYEASVPSNNGPQDDPTKIDSVPDGTKGGDDPLVGDGDDFGMGGDEGDSGFPDNVGDGTTPVCSIVSNITAGWFPTDLGQQRVGFRMKQVDPSPSLTNPRSLIFDSVLNTRVAKMDQVVIDQAETLQSPMTTLPAGQNFNGHLIRDAGTNNFEVAVQPGTPIPGVGDVVACFFPRADGTTETKNLEVVSRKTGKDGFKLCDPLIETPIGNEERIIAVCNFGLVSTQHLQVCAPEVQIDNVEIFRKGGKTVKYAGTLGRTGTQTNAVKGIFDSKLVKTNPQNLVRVDGLGNSIIYQRKVGAIGALVTQTGRVLDASDSMIRQEVLNDSVTGAIKQVRTPQGLACVDVVDQFEYNICFYDNGAYGERDTEGYFIPTSTPHTVWNFQNPLKDDTDWTNYRITKTKGSNSQVFDYEYDDTNREWTQMYGANASLSKTSKGLYDNLATSGTRIVWETKNAADELLEKRVEISEGFPWGESIVERCLDPEGADFRELTNYYDADATAAYYGKIKSRETINGDWIRWEYDDEGRPEQILRPLKDSTINSLASSAIEIAHAYESHDPDDTNLSYDKRPRTTIVTTEGQVTSKSFYVYKKGTLGQQITIREEAATPSAPYGDSDNLVTTSVYYPPYPESTRAEAGRVCEITYPDDRMTDFNYSFDSNTSEFITEIIHGSVQNPDGVAGKTTKSVILTSSRGNVSSVKEYVKTASDWALIEELEHSYDSIGNRTHSFHNGRLVYQALYQDGLMVYMMDAEGMEVSYTYDDKNRVLSKTKVGVPALGNYVAQVDIVETYEYDAMDRITKKSVEAGGISFSESWVYDGTGRVTEYTSPAGYNTIYSFSVDGSTVTETRPDTSTIITEYYRDGRKTQVTGTGVVHRFYEYSVLSNGNQSTKIYYGSLNSSRWQQSEIDMLGRVIAQRQSGFENASLETLYYYNSKGQLEKVSSPEAADQLFAYDEFSQRVMTALDVNGNGTIDLASTDRISETEYNFTSEGSNWFLTRKTKTYEDTASSDATIYEIIKTRLNGGESSAYGNLIGEVVYTDIHGNESVTETHVDAYSKMVTQVSTTADSTLPQTSVIINGLVMEASSSTVSEPTEFTYDALGRLISTAIPRHSGSSTTTYDPVSGIMISQTDPSGAMTVYQYHADGSLGAGQLKTVTNNEGLKTNYDYTIRGQVSRTWGTAVYPASYSYNGMGEMLTQTTYRGGYDTGEWTGGVWPSSPSAGDVSQFDYDGSSGLLLSRADAKGYKTLYDYSDAGLLTELTRGDGTALPTSVYYEQTPSVSVTYAYDAQTSELLTRSYSDSTPSVTFTYDRLGRSKTVADGTGTRTFDYNSQLQLDKETLPSYFGSDQRSVSYGYESAIGAVPGRQASMSIHNLPSGYTAPGVNEHTVGYSYGSSGRIAAVSANAHLIASQDYAYSYVNQSNLVASVTGPVHESVYGYEANRGLLTSLSNRTGAVGSQTVISEFTHAYDSIGRTTSVQQAGTAFSEDSFTKYGYNDHSEVISETRYSGSDLQDLSSPIYPESRTYGYDSIGSRIESKVPSAHSSGYDVGYTYTLNEMNQYEVIQQTVRDGEQFNQSSESIVYQDRGNMADYSGFDLTWNAENQLTQAIKANETRIVCEYDYIGRRVRKEVADYDIGTSSWIVSSDIKYLYNGWSLIAEYAEVGDFDARYYTWGLDRSGSVGGAGGTGGLVQMTEVISGVATHYSYTYDSKGNVSEILDQTGAIVAHYEYDSSGVELVKSGIFADRNPFRFSTKYYDAEIGLYYYGYRYYSPDLGRWVSADPIGEAGGLNLYGFNANRGVGFWDLMGLSTCGQTNEFNEAWLEDADPFGVSTEDIFGTDYSKPLLQETVDFNNDAAANLWNSNHNSVAQMEQSLYDLGYTDVNIRAADNELGYGYEAHASGHPTLEDYYDAEITANLGMGETAQVHLNDSPYLKGTPGMYGTPEYANSGSEYDWSFLEDPITQPQAEFDVLSAVQSVAEFGAGFIPFGSAVVELAKGNYKAALKEVAIEGAMIGVGALTAGLGYGVLKAGRNGIKSAEAAFEFGKKINKQAGKRGWNTSTIDDALARPHHISPATNRATGGDATAYFNRDGSYVVRENSTNEIIQLSNRNDLNWVPDQTIVNPYKP